MSDKKEEETQVQTAIRIPESWVVEFDKLAGLMSEPGRQASRADVHRMAIRRGLDVLAKEVKKR